MDRLSARGVFAAHTMQPVVRRREPNQNAVTHMNFINNTSVQSVTLALIISQEIWPNGDPIVTLFAKANTCPLSLSLPQF